MKDTGKEEEDGTARSIYVTHSMIWTEASQIDRSMPTRLAKQGQTGADTSLNGTHYSPAK